jgi:hypothetical protein
MSILRKVFGLSIIGIALMASLPADARLAANELSANRLAANRLAANRLAANRLAANAFTTNPGEGGFSDVAAVELSNGMRLTR